MLTPDLAAAAQDYARSRAEALETVLPPSFDEDVWSQRLQSWFAACETAPWSALGGPGLETAVTDLVTLELSCQSYAATAQGLEVTDRGGTVWARKGLVDLLMIVARHDPGTARALAALARRTRNDRLHRIRSLILARA